MEQFIRICVYVLAGILGLCVGSFLNVVIYRVPRQMSVAFPGSHCTACGYPLRWYDNIPVVSWVVLGGKCRKCGAPISIRYSLVELTNMLLWLASVARFWQDSPVYACLCALALSVLICIFCIDLEHMLIYNRFVILLALAGVAAMFLCGDTQPLDHLIGAAVGGGVFALVYYGAMAALKKEGLGFGDVKLAAAAGLLLGWQKLILAVLLASVIGSILLICLNRLRNLQRDTEYPFGPFLVGGMAVALLFGEQILSWYLALLLG